MQIDSKQSKLVLFFIFKNYNKIVGQENKSLDIYVKEQLTQWAIEENITSTALNKLLRILKPVIPILPLDSRTLKQTPRSVQKYELNEGFYVHYGIQDSLTDFFRTNDLEMEILVLNFNVDGLPLVKSTGAQVWPILMSIKDTEVVMLVGVYESYTKPTDVSG